MRQPDNLSAKIYDLPQLLRQVEHWRKNNGTIAFTNGCFDILHEGHIYSLFQAAQEADYLIVAINSDNSVKKLKGSKRPINKETSRAIVVAALAMVDAVIIFDDETPLHVISKILPNVLVKGGDYTMNQIAGSKEVIAAGGKVVINPILTGYSTTALIEKFQTKI